MVTVSMMRGVHLNCNTATILEVVRFIKLNITAQLSKLGVDDVAQGSAAPATTATPPFTPPSSPSKPSLLDTTPTLHRTPSRQPEETRRGVALRFLVNLSTIKLTLNQDATHLAECYLEDCGVLYESQFNKDSVFVAEVRKKLRLTDPSLDMKKAIHCLFPEIILAEKDAGRKANLLPIPMEGEVEEPDIVEFPEKVVEFRLEWVKDPKRREAVGYDNLFRIAVDSDTKVFFNYSFARRLLKYFAELVELSNKDSPATSPQPAEKDQLTIVATEPKPKIFRK